MPHAVLSRRGAFGLAALLSFVRPVPAGGAHARAIAGEVLELRALGEGICLDSCGLEPIRAALPRVCRTGGAGRASRGPCAARARLRPADVRVDAPALPA